MVNILCIGASTGGPRALIKVLEGIEGINAAVLIVQHTPPGFDTSLVEMLSAHTKMPCLLATHQGLIERGKVYLAPALRHMTLLNNERTLIVEGQRVNHVCPSIDVLMKSVQRPRYGRVGGVILTGMGKDGADGIAHIKGLGGSTISQDEKTCTIYGMPKAAFETGKVDFVLPLEAIAPRLLTLFGTL